MNSNLYFKLVTVIAWLVSVPAAVSQADVVTFDLDNVWLLPDITRPWEPARQMTGAFEWMYEVGDFENGSGQFIELYTPWYNPGIQNLNITVETSSIEFSLIGNFHDLGLDLTMFPLDPLSADQPVAIDLVRSQFEIQQGVIYQGHFVSGSIVPRGVPNPSCDFGGDGNCDIDDIDALILEIAAMTNDPMFDLNGDETVDLDDRNEWLAQAGALNLPSENSYLLADFTLDGVVDGQDFILWNEFKFTGTGKWSMGDANGDGVTDGQDFIEWNHNKFMSSASLSAVPEPGTAVLSLVALILLGIAGLRR